MSHSRKLVGAAAGCAVAISSVMGLVPASAQDACLNCDEDPPAVVESGAPNHAMLKIGVVAPADRVFYKISDSSPAFAKIEDVGPTNHALIKIGIVVPIPDDPVILENGQ